MRKLILLEAFSLQRLLRLRLHSWATASDGTDNTLSVSEAFKSATDTIWGESAFSSERAKLWQNWDVMVFWLEVLQASWKFFFNRGQTVRTTHIIGGGRRCGCHSRACRAMYVGCVVVA